MAHFAAALQLDRGRWFWLLLILLALDVVFGLGDSASQLLRYDRSAIAAGGWWRLLTGSPRAFGCASSDSNELGLVLMWRCSPTTTTRSIGPSSWPVRRAGHQFGALVAESASGLVCGRLGRSAFHHGGGSGQALDRPDLGPLILLVGLGAKLAYEQLGGREPPWVVIDAHLYGAICGFLVGLHSAGRGL